MKFYKTVLMPITVTEGDYCWGGVNVSRSCEHFNNIGGCPECDLGFRLIKYDKSGSVPKPKECKELKDAV